jgi:hypothetical protein
MVFLVTTSPCRDWVICAPAAFLGSGSRFSAESPMTFDAFSCQIHMEFLQVASQVGINSRAAFFYLFRVSKMNNTKPSSIKKDDEGYAYLAASFDPLKLSTQDKRAPMGSVFEWMAREGHPLAQFSFDYINGRLRDFLCNHPPIKKGNCHITTGTRKPDGYPRPIKLSRSRAIQNNSTPLTHLVLLRRGYIIPKGYHVHHSCCSGNDGCLGDLEEVGRPRHCVPIPATINAQMKCKKCWGHKGQKCTGHKDGPHTWPPCTPTVL